LTHHYRGLDLAGQAPDEAVCVALACLGVAAISATVDLGLHLRCAMAGALAYIDVHGGSWLALTPSSQTIDRRQHLSGHLGAVTSRVFDLLARLALSLPAAGAQAGTEISDRS
jgi:hypothetical protein